MKESTWNAAAAASDRTRDDLTEEIASFRNSAESLLAGAAGHERIRRLRHSPSGFDRDAWQMIVSAGWPALLVPEAKGGLGLGLDHAAAIVREVGYALTPEPVIAAAFMSPYLLAALPSGARRDRLLETVLERGAVIGLAWQEPIGKPGTPAGACIARRLPGGQFILDGVWSWVVPGHGADGWIVSVQLDDVPALLFVPAGQPGASCKAQPRIDGSPMGCLALSGAVLSADALLAEGEAAGRLVVDAVDLGRLLQAVELAGVARRAFDDTLTYVKTRHQFGRPIGANQVLQHRLVDAYLQVQLMDAALAQSLSALRHAPDDLAIEASRCKARCASAAVDITRMAVQLHGAMGYTDECSIGLYLKRALHLASWLGNAQEHRMRFQRLSATRSPTVGRTDQTAAPASAFPRCADWAAMPTEQFCALIRGFLHTHYPQTLRNIPRRLRWHEIGDWYLTLSRQGWLAPSWPRRYGGMELPPDKLLAFVEELEDYGVARLPDQGLINLGPLLIQCGTEAQKDYWLPRILSGEHIWCQGYSEPGAGSDLAALRTSAIPDGDFFVVNGQKIWTTLAMDATHVFLLVRTGQFERKQEGISFLLCDLATPGVSIRPILNLAGEEEFCEIFFDDVRVPRENLVGELHQGWQLAKTLLGHERIFIGSPKTSQYALGRLRLLGETLGIGDDPEFAARFAGLHLDLIDLRALYAHFADIVRRGEPLPPSVSVLKIWASETYTRIGLALAEAAGPEGGAQGDVSFGKTTIAPTGPLVNALVTTIYGGTNEVQRNILARQVLELPTNG